LVYAPIELLWVIGFAVSTILAVAILSYQSYKKYIFKKQSQMVNSDKEIAKQQTEIEKWKRKVFRP
jgi:Tfp pilus assembly protein PilE